MNDKLDNILRQKRVDQGLTKYDVALASAIKEGDLNKESRLLSSFSPYDVKQIYSNLINRSLEGSGVDGRAVVNDFELPRDDLSMDYMSHDDTSGAPPIFSEPERPRLILRDPKNAGNGFISQGYYDPNNNSIVVDNKDPATALHEMSHKADAMAGYPGDESVYDRNTDGKTGLANALNTFAGHNEGGKIVSRTHLWNILNGLPVYDTPNSADGPILPPDSPGNKLFQDLRDIKKFSIDGGPSRPMPELVKTK